VEFDGLVELRVMNLLQNAHRVFDRVGTWLDLLFGGGVFLSDFGHI